MYPFNTTRKDVKKNENQMNLMQQHKFNFDLVYGQKDTNRDVYE